MSRESDVSVGSMATCPCYPSSHRTLKGEDQALDRPRSDAPLDVRVGDVFEHPALPRLVVQDLLQLVAGQRPADQALAKFDDPILTSLRMSTMSHVSTMPPRAVVEITPRR